MPNHTPDVKHALVEIKKDWEKFPNFIKFCFAGGFLVLLFAWLVRTADTSFIQVIGFWLFFALVIAFPVIYWLGVKFKIIVYRSRYPIENLGSDFLFAKVASHKDAIHIIDTERKEIRWIENARTAYDLGYYPAAWVEVIQLESFADTIEEESDSINLSKFALRRGIRTQGKPGD